MPRRRGLGAALREIGALRDAGQMDAGVAEMLMGSLASDYISRELDGAVGRQTKDLYARLVYMLSRSSKEAGAGSLEAEEVQLWRSAKEQADA